MRITTDRSQPYLIDSNILLRLAKRDHPEYPLVRRAVTALQNQGANLYYAMQNMAEFWNASTRPVEKNGFGMTIEETNANALDIEGAFALLPDNEAVYYEWRRLVVNHSVRGVRVHDARLAAILYAYGFQRILSFNRLISGVIPASWPCIPKVFLPQNIRNNVLASHYFLPSELISRKFRRPKS